MASTTFLILAAMVLVAIAFAGFLRKPPPAPESPPQEEVKRWAVFRLHLDRLLAGDAAVALGLPGGPLLFRKGLPDPRRPRLVLLGKDRRPRIDIRTARRFGRRLARISLDGSPLAELRGGRKGKLLEEVRPRSLDLEVTGDAATLELEMRRGGKLVASVSADIAPEKDAVGVEVLAGTDPLPAIAVAAGIGLLRGLAPPARA